jgi:spore coat polysaccharide biosynthesis protein SpsF
MIIACIQVRLSSKRLPKKAIIALKKKPIFLHVVERLQCVKKINKVVVCTSQNTEDLPIIDICKKNNIEYFAGSENNVIKRFIDAVDKNNPDHIIRSTGENPCVSYEFIDLAIEKHIESKADYTTTDELPRGMRAEVINFNFLKKLHKNLINPNAEYVTWYLDRPEKWKVNKISVCEKLRRNKYRVTIDTIDDLNVVKKIYDALYKDNPISSLEIVKFLDNNQDIVSLNKNYKHRLYEDYKESVEIRTFEEIRDEN